MSVGYLAARYSRRLELCEYRAALEERGHKVLARWLLGEHQVHGLEASKAIEDDGPIPAELAVLFGNDDVEDILASDWMINFTEPPRTGPTRGGRHVECGIFLGLKFMHNIFDVPRKLFIVGELENVFHAIPEIDGRFDTFDKFIDALDKGYISL